MGDKVAVRIIWTGRAFAKAVANARSARGVYDPSTRTWAIPAAVIAALTCEPRFRGWDIVGAAQAAPVACAHWTRDQGCPLHGEACPGAR